MPSKSTKIIYWTTTGLFVAFMLFSAIPDAMVVEEAKVFITHLGYPVYFIPFIGVAKILGSIALLVPGFRTIKEWAYAGLFYDLVGAVYSGIMVDGFDPAMLTMVVVFGVMFTSYFFNRRMYPIKGELIK
ncbi:MAG: DoxX family protein [Bacteroidia bacterium]|jgi:hypothetical protein